MAGETMNPAECGLNEQKQKRYVDINPAIEFLKGYDNSWGREFANGIHFAVRYIEKLPTDEVEEIKHGHWVKAERRGCVTYNVSYAECSNCHGEPLQFCRDFKYCPWCGAKMDEEDGK